jgi:AcrR family transcriptional regulator
MDTRLRMLEAAETQLAASADRDISTREVCEAVNVGSPVLYRLFGDKNGLLTAVVDHAFERYLGQKRTQQPSEDPVDDLYTAWDNHVAFALANPTVYRLVYAPSLAAVPAAAEEARQLLIDRLVRCAEAGRLRIAPDAAAQAFMAACVGVTLSLLSEPEAFSDPGLSCRVRDAVIRDLVAEAEPLPFDKQSRAVQPIALQLAALIRRAPPLLTPAETSLLLQWLDAIGDAAVLSDN